MKEYRQQSKDLLNTYRGPFSKSLLAILFINGLLVGIADDNLMMSFIAGVLFFMLISAFQIVVLHVLKERTSVNFKDTLDVLKKHLVDLLLLGLMVQMVSFILSAPISFMTTPIIEKSSEKLELFLELVNLLTSVGISYMVTYMFLFAPYYIGEKNRNAFDAFRDSYQDTKGLKRDMFKLESPYLFSVLGAFLFVLIVSIFLKSEAFALLGLLVSSVYAMVRTIDLFTVRTIFYLNEK